MKTTKTTAFLLLGSLFSINIQPMEQQYLAEQELIDDRISVESYLLTIEKSSSGHAHMVLQLRTADYRQLPGESYYEKLIGKINNVVQADQLSSSEGSRENRVILRGLKFKIRRLIENYYNRLKNGKRSGLIKEGREL